MRLFHKHEWKFLHAMNGEYVFVKGFATQITYRCEGCGKYKQVKLDGHLGKEVTEAEGDQ